MINYLYDTHFHLDLMGDPKQVVAQIESSGVYTIAVTNLPAVFDNTLQLTKNSKYVRAALGLHPELAFEHKSQLELFKSLLSYTRYVGEVGLDNFNKSPSNYEIQKKVFESLILICNDAKGKILTVHSRRAEKDVISIIGPKFSGKVILHWYSGSAKELERALSNGYYFSVNHTMTQSDNGKNIILKIPVERMLLETDGPFVLTDNQPCTPLMVDQIVQKIEGIKKQKNIGEILYKNFCSILSPP